MYNDIYTLAMNYKPKTSEQIEALTNIFKFLVDCKCKKHQNKLDPIPDSCEYCTMEMFEQEPF